MIMEYPILLLFSILNTKKYRYMKMNDMKLREKMHQELLKKHGEIVGGINLCRLMGFSSTAAFRQSLIRGQIPIQTFEIPHRKGRFAYTRDVVNWLCELSNSSETLDK